MAKGPGSSTPVGRDASKAEPNHSPRFYVDEASLAVGTRTLAQPTVDYLAMDSPEAGAHRRCIRMTLRRRSWTPSAGRWTHGAAMTTILLDRSMHRCPMLDVGGRS